jgi:hypothetical protein
MITPFDLRTVAGELLDQGEDTPALIELFALSDDAGPWEGPQIFEQVLTELGAPEQTEHAAADAVARWLAQSVLETSLSAREAVDLGARLYITSDHKHDALLRYYLFDDDYWLRPVEDVDHDVHQFAEQIVAQA